MTSSSTPPSQPSLQTRTTPGPAPNGQGRGLFASSDLRLGDNILHIQDPFVAVLDSNRLEDTCSGCFGQRQLAAPSGREIVLKACTGCKIVKYCDKTCQAKDWRLAHSRECGMFKILSPKVLPINARALLRMVLRTHVKKNAYSEQELEAFGSLDTHIRDIRAGNTEQWERIALTSKAVKEYSKTELAEEEICAYGAKLELNAFNLTNALYDRVGLYLHPYAALMNHDCNYNAIVAFDGLELYVKPTRPIAKDEQILISYIDTTFSTRIRQKQLQERYFFTCTCTKCTTPEPPTPTGSEIEDVVNEATKNILDFGPSPSTPQRGFKPVPIPEQDRENTLGLASWMQSLIEHSWPKHAQPFPGMMDELIALDLNSGLFLDAFLHCALRFSRIDPLVFPNEAHPLRLIHAFTFAKLCLYHSDKGTDLTLPETFHGPFGVYVAVNEVQVDCGLLGWTLLAELVSKEGSEAGGCMAPGFWAIAKRMFREVHSEFVANGADPRELGKEIREQWQLLGKVMGEMWRNVYREK
ncbi:hypothetical protein BJY04DRAFT_218957 [Aspergillus karnatakaensis]|uniref:S-adenosylmethionine-dependent methyltransferase n=1 Tax=Aspergillus karnatakaensis TaxID=1810916 RepID=UPI003CCCD1A1